MLPTAAERAAYWTGDNKSVAYGLLAELAERVAAGEDPAQVVRELATVEAKPKGDDKGIMMSDAAPAGGE